MHSGLFIYSGAMPTRRSFREAILSTITGSWAIQTIECKDQTAKKGVKFNEGFISKLD